MFWRKRESSDPSPRKWPEGYTVTNMRRHAAVNAPGGECIGVVFSVYSGESGEPCYTSEWLPFRRNVADALLDLALHHEEQVRRAREAGIVFVAPRDAT